MRICVRNKKDFAESALIVGLALLWHMITYYGARMIAGSWEHIDMTMPFDLYVPFLPWTISIYWGAYLFWAVSYLILALGEKGERNRFFCAEMITRGICVIFFLALPTTNIRPEIVGTGLWDNLMRALYRADAADNLFPSVHCVLSWLCWVGVRKRKDLPVAYRYFALIAAIAICLSTLTTRQHIVFDVVAGILISEICYFVAGLPKVSRAFSRIISCLMRVLNFETKKSE